MGGLLTRKHRSSNCLILCTIRTNFEDSMKWNVERMLLGRQDGRIVNGWFSLPSLFRSIQEMWERYRSLTMPPSLSQN
jgi:hypothetical protein